MRPHIRRIDKCSYGLRALINPGNNQEFVFPRGGGLHSGRGSVRGRESANYFRVTHFALYCLDSTARMVSGSRVKVTVTAAMFRARRNIALSERNASASRRVRARARRRQNARASFRLPLNTKAIPSRVLFANRCGR